MRLVLLTCFAVVASSCVCGVAVIHGGDGGSDGGLHDGGTDAGSASDAGRDAGSGDAGVCVEGASCADGGVCAGGQCCAPTLACGGQCCAAGKQCSFLSCVAPGGPCVDTADCQTGWFCDLAHSTAGTSDAGVCVTARTPGQCIPEPPQCGPDAGAAAGRSCVERCRFTRTTQQFRPVVKYAWGDPNPPHDTDVMMAPIVAQLDDDDCDGRITSQDQPDLVFVTFSNGDYTHTGVVHALSVSNGQLREKWARPAQVNAMSQLASGDIDGKPGNEVVGCDTGRVVAMRGKDGTVLWTTPDAGSCRIPSLADLDGDGLPEVVTETQIIDGVTGAIKTTFSGMGNTVVADLDGDGTPDLISAGRALHGDGTPLASVTGLAGFVAIGDLDKDGHPEVVSVNSSTHQLAIWTYDSTATTKGRIIRSGIDINQGLDPARCPPGSAGNVGGGGPPTIGDFNADGYPDIALAGGVGYVVFDGKKLADGSPVANALLWSRETQDCSSAATGSTLFDFDGDGKVEAVYADEENLHVYDSATGTELFTTCNTSGTLIEYPLVADLDNDGQADLIVVSNAYAFSCVGNSTRFAGVRVFSSMDNNWVVTRRVWNQHAYVVTNIEENGKVPSPAMNNWQVAGLNNFRQNKQPGSEFAAADAVVSVTGVCLGNDVELQVTLRNVGEASIPAGLRVELVADPKGTAKVLGTLTSSRALGPTQSETFTFTTSETSVHALQIIARVVAGGLRECRTDNDQSDPIVVGCIE